MAAIAKSDYLKRYLSTGDNDRKKKTKKKEKEKNGPPKKQLEGIKIIETDAFASVAAASDMEDFDSDEELEIQMLNEEIRNKAKKGSMKGAFKSTFTSIDNSGIKVEVDEDQEDKISRPTFKEELPNCEDSKIQMSLTGKRKSETVVRAEKDSRSSNSHLRRRHDSDSDESQKQGRSGSSRKSTNRENKSPRRTRHDSDSSPPRKRRYGSPDQSPPRRRRNESDNSPPRNRRHNSRERISSNRRQRHDSDNSPPRQGRQDSDESPPRRRSRRDSDQSPPRSRRRKDSDQSPPRYRKAASPVIQGKGRTLDGKIAGLQSAKDLRAEADRMRAKEAKMFEEMDATISGRDADTRVREKQVRRGRKDKPEDIEKKEREALKQAELAEKYKDWNKGVKQLQDRQEQLDELTRIVAGPMTRTAEDVDMNQYLKDKIHESDPMASMIKRKNREEAIDRGDLIYPIYDKPFPPNRYGIRPGYRWDGVDRSNGFENKLAISQNARQAVEREMYSNSNFPLEKLDNSGRNKKSRRVYGPKGEVNACISFLMFCSQVYITYISIFKRPFLQPFSPELSDNSTSKTELSSNQYSTSVFSVLFITILGIIVGYLVHLLRLPALLGMLLVGIALRNIPWTGSAMFIVKDWGVVLRRTAFIIILLRGGLSLDAGALRRMKGACLRLAFLPCTTEAIAVALAAKICFQMDILYGLLLGFVLAAVSPAVVVPAMLEAAKEGYGMAKGVPTLVIAAASLDDVYAITCFSLLITIIFSTGSGMVMTIIRAPVEVFAGVFFGTFVGLILRYFPSPDLKNLHLIRGSLLVAFSTALLFGTTAVGVDSIGAIAVLVAAFVAGHSWKEEGALPEEDHLSNAWHLFFQPVLFGLIGFELSFSLLSFYSVGFGLLVLFMGLLVRTIASSLAVLGCSLSFKERLFVAIAWLPKATVQAALAPVALDYCSSRDDLPREYGIWSVLIFAITVLSILTTAPVGAFLIRLTYPFLLTKNSPETMLG